MDATIARIELDTRHRNVSVLFFGPIKHRHFQDWSQMPTIKVSNSNPELDDRIAELRAAPRDGVSDEEIIRMFETLTTEEAL